MIQDKIFFDEKDPTGLSYNTPFTFYGSYQGRLWSKSPSGSIQYYTQNSDLSAYATTGSNRFSGSQTITGSLTVTGGITGTATTASYVEYANVANRPALISGSAQIASFGYATTGSNGFNGSQSITGSLTVTGQVVAQTLNVQQVTSSIVFSSGSNIFGNSVSNTQQFTGSLQVTGSSHYLLGNVGIGTTSPNVPLEIQADSGGTAIRIKARAAANSGTLRFFNNASSTQLAKVESSDNSFEIGSLNNVFAAFLTNSTERMRITSGGNVGIGTSSPAAIISGTETTLNVKGNVASAVGSIVARSFGTTNATAIGIAAFDTINQTAIFTESNSPMAFYTNSSERMRITSGGNTEIRSGNSLLVYNTANTRSGYLTTSGNGTELSSFAGAGEPLILIAPDSTATIRFYTGGSTVGNEKMRITSGGNVGIGTDSPIDYGAGWRNLAINGPSSGSQIDFMAAGVKQGFVAGGTTAVEIGSSIDTPLRFYTNGTIKATLTSGGNVGIGTTSPSAKLHIDSPTSGASNEEMLRITRNTAGQGIRLMNYDGGSGIDGFTLKTLGSTNLLHFRMDGNVGIGTASPSARLHVLNLTGGNTPSNYLQIEGATSDNNNYPSILLKGGTLATTYPNIALTNGGLALSLKGGFSPDYNTPTEILLNLGNITFLTGTGGTLTERMRITSGGNVGIGVTPSAWSVLSPALEIGTGGSFISAQGATSALYTGTNAFFNGSNWIYKTNGFASYSIQNGGEHQWFNAPSGTAGNAITFTERMRITSGGDVLVGATSFPAGERMMLQKTEAAPLGLDRRGSDGGILRFYHDGTEEGNVTTSGTTVSYNGGHLSRYSQTSTNTKIEGLVKGTVMSNLDQMAVWINPETGEPYPNEQLNCMKISDIEGDKNVAGVFVNWDNDDQVSTNDMNIAMTGDMIIRIAQGVTVQRGDLLISAGDGTAKPQDDDIIRNSTIAKVTSTHVTCTYEDGSYCVPCVLMAC